ncbi:MAG: hypothetical protein KDA75_04610, partial [Planctomycetaceae bacterium]|nr:hypothetical protein [Planctomycetaceae bacterium]
MKLRRKYTWLLTAPLAWLSGCGVGPISGLADREPVVSLKHPDPLVALNRSTEIEAADAGAFSTAEWHARSDDPEEQRMFLLSGARRRMQQQAMMEMLMTPLSTTSPTHQASPSAPTQSSKSGSKPTSPKPTTSKPAPAIATPNPMMLPGGFGGGTVSPELAAGAPLPTRRTLRGQRPVRGEDKLDRAETSASTEADRIERAADAEAVRAEKAAVAEAQLLERRMQAEAELVERMTRAELELAERLAEAKDDRDRRIAMAREERQLRMAILGIDADELETDPVDEALSKLERKQPTREGDSGLTRFTRFFRSRSEEPQERIATSAPRQTETHREPPPREAIADARREDPRDLVDRTLEHSDSLLNSPTIAEFASSIPNEAPAITRQETAPRREGPEELHSSLLDDWPASDKYDSLLAQDEVFPADNGGNTGKEDWSLLDDFMSPETSVADSRDSGTAAEFPNNSAPSFPELDQALHAPQEDPAIAAANERPQRGDQTNPDRRDPTLDLWILGEERNESEAARTDDWPAVADGGASREFPESAARDVVRPEEFTSPGGLFAQAEANQAHGKSVPERPTVDVPSASTGTGLLDDFLTASSTSQVPPTTTGDIANQAPAAPADERGSSDPWVSRQPQLDLAATVPSDPPVFDWSTSADELVDRVVHTQPPAAHPPIQSAAWTSQSLRDACGQLPADLEALVLQLDIPEAGVRKAVLADLANLGAKARPALPAVRVLLDDSPLVAAHAAWT